MWLFHNNMNTKAETMQTRGSSITFSVRIYGDVVIPFSIVLRWILALSFILNVLLLKNIIRNDIRFMEVSNLSKENVISAKNTTIYNSSKEALPGKVFKRTRDGLVVSNLSIENAISSKNKSTYKNTEVVKRTRDGLVVSNLSIENHISTKNTTNGLLSREGVKGTLDSPSDEKVVRSPITNTSLKLGLDVSNTAYRTDEWKQKTCSRRLERCPIEISYIKRELQKKWTKHSPRLVSVRGERHSGTKLARQLIDDNAYGLSPVFHRSTYSDEIYGWKHGFFHSDGQTHPSDILLVISRDVFSWILSMFNEPYNMMFEEGMTEFRTFLMGHYWAQKCQVPLTLVPKDCTFPMEEAKNIIQV